MREDLEDIKQLLDASFNVAFHEYDKKMEKRLGNLQKHFDARFSDQDEKLDAILDAVGAELADHEKRITRLEHQAA